MERNLTKKAERIKDKERLSTVITNKMVIVFLALVAAITVLVRISSNGLSEIKFVIALPYISAAFALLTAGALVWEILSFKKGVDARYINFSAPLVLGILASGLFASLVYTTVGGAFRTVLVLLGFALLFFVYEIFSVDFFASSVAAVVACIAATIINSSGVSLAAAPFVKVLCVLASAVCSIGGAYFVYRLVTDKRINIFGRKIRKPLHCVPAAVYTVFAVSLATVIASLIFGYLLYCIAVIAVVYFVATIIYTVKLM